MEITGRETIPEFLGKVRETYGDHVADLCNERLAQLPGSKQLDALEHVRLELAGETNAR